MTDIKVVSPEMDVSGVHLVESLPGTGLVAKIAGDYLMKELDMELYAEVYAKEMAQVAVFEKDDPGLKPPVRIFVNEEKGIGVLRSDAPISGQDSEFIEKIIEWMDEQDFRPVFQSGLPIDVKEGDHQIFHTVVGDFDLGETDTGTPPIDGGIGGPTGALLEEAIKNNIDAVCFVIESDPNFPDPQASRLIIEKGIEPLVGFDIDTQQLAESADRIKQKKKQVAQQLQEVQEQKSSEAYPREMYK